MATIDQTQALLAPDIAAQQMMLDRRQQMADLLRQQSLTQDQGQMIGNAYVAPSWTQGLAKMAQALIASKSQDNIDSQRLDLAKQYQGKLAEQIDGPAVPGTTGPTVANAARMDANGGDATAALTPVRANPTGMTLAALLKGRAVDALGGSGASGAYWDNFKTPDSIKALIAQGINPLEAGGWARNEAAVKGVLPIRQGMTIGKVGADGTVTPTFTAPDQDTGTFTRWGENGPVVSAIPGASDVKRVMSTASAQGPATFKAAPTQYGPDNKPLPLQSEAEVFAPQSQGGDVPGAGLDVSKMSSAQIQALAASDPLAFAKGVERFKQSSQPQRGTPVPTLGANAAADASQSGAPKAMNESYGALQKARAGGSAALQDIDHMLQLGSKKSPLVAGDYATGIAKIFSPNAAEYEKSRDNLVTQLSGQLGMSTDSAREMVYGSIPAYGAPKQAIQNGLSNLRNQVQARMLKADFLTPSFNSGNASDFTTKENQFDMNIKPSVVPLLQMPAGPARAKALAEAAKDPQNRASLEWAAQNGLLK